MDRKERSTVLSAIALCAAVCITLSGCVTSQPVALPDGTEGLAIDCSYGDNIAACMNYAAEKCGGPYRVFGQEKRKVPHASGAGDTVSITNSVDRVLIVKCGKEETEQ